MVDKLIVYQKRMNFVLTRTRQEQVLDAEEFLNNLRTAREQLEATKEQIREFERDIKIMEKLEKLAIGIRYKEIKRGKEERDNLK